MKFPQPFFYIHTGRSLIDFYSKVVGFLRLSVFFFSSTWSSKITVTKEKKRKNEEKERKRREKNNGCALGRKTKKNIWHSVMKEEANNGSSL